VQAAGRPRAVRDAPWRANRPAGPDLFISDLDQTLRALGDTPSLGSMYQARTRSSRRMLLRRTHYRVYFVEEADRLYVVAVWSAFRARRPKPQR
jgi:plasmid stabilization system protein ParE